MDSNTIAVIGAGNAGFGTAGDLAIRGWSVNLFELLRFEEMITPIVKKGGIEVNGTEIDGEVKGGFAKMNMITTEISRAIENASWIIIHTWATIHEEVAHLISPHLQHGQKIVILPGNGGSFIFRKVLKEKRPNVNVMIAETSTIPYGCRKVSPVRVNVMRTLGKIGIAALPAKDNAALFNQWKTLFPNTGLLTNVVEAILFNPNLYVHPVPTMLSIARIENSQRNFGLYAEGFTPSVLMVMDGLDKELMEIQKALGLPVTSYKKQFEMRYNRPFKEHFYGVLLGPDAPRGPYEVTHRYITEDVPMGLAFSASLGRLLGVPTPTYDAVIHLTGLMNGKDFYKEGRTLESLGLSKLKVEAFKKYLSEG